MIDTDKYEGHTEAPWDKLSEYCPVGSIDKQLIADAPLLLEEVKRLREQIKLAYDWVDYQFPDGGMQDFAKYIGDEEE
jgi:hypothetical protein